MENFHLIGRSGLSQELYSFIASSINKILVIASIDVINCLYDFLNERLKVKKKEDVTSAFTIAQHHLFNAMRKDLKFEDAEKLPEFTQGFKPLIALQYEPEKEKNK